MKLHPIKATQTLPDRTKRKKRKVKVDRQSNTCLSHAGGEMKIKLILLFIVMDLLTFLAYPVLFVRHKLNHLSKPVGNDASTIAPIIVSTS
jgi:hypothetical protein